MRLLDLAAARVQDLPVCFPGHPCIDYNPIQARVIDLTSSLTPLSPAIAAGCFTVLAVGVVVIVRGLRPRSPAPGLWIVAMSTATIVAGVLVQGLARVRLAALDEVPGLAGGETTDLSGAWPLVGLAGEFMAVAGVACLVATATIAVVWLRSALRRFDVDERVP